MKTPEGRFSIKVKKSDGSIKKYSFPWVIKNSDLDICDSSKNKNFNLKNKSYFFKLKKSNKQETFSSFYKLSKNKSNENS